MRRALWTPAAAPDLTTVTTNAPGASAPAASTLDDPTSSADADTDYPPDCETASRRDSIVAAEKISAFLRKQAEAGDEPVARPEQDAAPTGVEAIVLAPAPSPAERFAAESEPTLAAGATLAAPSTVAPTTAEATPAAIAQARPSPPPPAQPPALPAPQAAQVAMPAHRRVEVVMEAPCLGCLGGRGRFGQRRHERRGSLSAQAEEEMRRQREADEATQAAARAAAARQAACDEADIALLLRCVRAHGRL